VQRLPCAVIAVQRGSEFLSLFVTVSFLKVRARPDARKDVSIRSQHPLSGTCPVLMLTRRHSRVTAATLSTQL